MYKTTTRETLEGFEMAAGSLERVKSRCARDLGAFLALLAAVGVVMLAWIAVN